ncbi:MAG: hypothetical protein IPK16_02805 [Anaerolineales bacterium]|nr:hypothetical protein [Anaerolineales bacterium]
MSAFEDRVQQATTSANLLGESEIGPDVLALVGEHEMALGGVGVIIAAQVTRKIVTSIAQRMSQRVAGRIASRILGKAGSTVIPVAGWLIGTGMIVYDIYDSREGALPQVQESLKLEQVKRGVRSEIAASIAPELEAELPGLARIIANDLFVEWRNTKRNIRQVLDLAAKNKAFAGILAEMPSPDQVARLVDLVSLVQQSGGPDALETSIGDGTLQRVALLPASATTIVADSGSLQSAITWYQTVGNRLNDVVAMELHKQTAPESINLSQLDALLALGDKTAVSRLSLLDAEAQTELLRLPTEPLVQLANQLAPDQLSWLASELPNLAAAQRNQLVGRMLSQPAVAPSLQALGNLSQLAAAGSLDKAITFVTGAKDPVAYWADTLAVVTGEVPADLFWAKHGPWPSLGAIGALLLVFLIALRLAYGAGAWLVAPLSIFLRRRR